MSNFTTNPYGSPKFRDITKQCTFSWETAPTAITAGTFPDSFTDGNHETKLEFYDTHTGSSIEAVLGCSLPFSVSFIIIADIGLGARIGSTTHTSRYVFSNIVISSEQPSVNWSSFLKNQYPSSYSVRFIKDSNSLPLGYGNYCNFMFRVAGAGDFAFEIYDIKILELVGV